MNLNVTVRYPRSSTVKLTEEDHTKLMEMARELHVSPSEVLRMLLRQAEVVSKPRVYLSHTQ